MAPAFEILKSTTSDHPKSFYTNTFRSYGPVPDPEYQTKVLSRKTSPLYASLDWLKESNAVDDGDMQVFERVKGCRKELAHEPTKLIYGALRPDLPQRFAELVGLVDKIEKWWIVNVDMALLPAFDEKEVDPAGIISGPVLCLRLMVDIALGSDETSRYYIDEFLKRKHTTKETDIN